MTTTVALADPLAVEFGISEIDIARARANYRALTADSREGYEAVRHAIAQLRSTRTGIEKRRVEMKASALEFGRKVDSVAKHLTALIVDIEAPLAAKKAAVDDEKERLKREAERAELLALEAKLKAEREAEEAKRRAEREVEEERLRVEAVRLAELKAADEVRLRAEEARLAAQRAADEDHRRRIDDEQRAEAERLAAERRALDEQRQALEAQQREAARVEQERQRAARAEQEAKDQAERDRQAAERTQQEAAEAAARLEKMRPDIERVRAWGRAIFDFSRSTPVVESVEAREAIAWVVGRLEALARALEMFKPKGTP